MLTTGQSRNCIGFSMVELMITLAVLAILVAAAMPSFQTWILNIQVRNATESMTSGLQRARSEAVARNASVAYILGPGTSWTVKTVSPVATLDSRSSSEGSQKATVTPTPTAANTITFNSLGLVIPNADATDSLTQLDVSASGATAPLRVVISTSGSARMCDPSLASGSGPRAC